MRASVDAERGLVGVEQRFHLGAVMRFHLPQPDDLAHDLAIIAIALGFRIDVADVVGDALFLLLEPFDPLDEQPQLIGCDIIAHVILQKI